LDIPEGPGSFYTGGDYAAILVTIQYLTAIEGDLWRKVRGLGLAFGYDMTVSPEQGLLLFTLYKSADLCMAYQEAQDIIRGEFSIGTWKRTQ